MSCDKARLVDAVLQHVGVERSTSLCASHSNDHSVHDTLVDHILHTTSMLLQQLALAICRNASEDDAQDAASAASVTASTQTTAAVIEAIRSVTLDELFPSLDSHTSGVGGNTQSETSVPTLFIDQLQTEVVRLAQGTRQDNNATTSSAATTASEGASACQVRPGADRVSEEATRTVRTTLYVLHTLSPTSRALAILSALWLAVKFWAAALQRVSLNSLLFNLLQRAESMRHGTTTAPLQEVVSSHTAVQTAGCDEKTMVNADAEGDDDGRHGKQGHTTPPALQDGQIRDTREAEELCTTPLYDEGGYFDFDDDDVVDGRRLAEDDLIGNLVYSIEETEMMLLRCSDYVIPCM